jgi:hypothetical protein
MNSQVFPNSKIASTALLRTPVSFPDVNFGPATYRITDPLPTWFQASPENAPECLKCGDTLTFIFRPRVDQHSDGMAEAYQTPVAIRCNCFLAEGGSALLTLTYHLELNRTPIPIVAVAM